MEDGLVPQEAALDAADHVVLILVVVEDGLVPNQAKFGWLQVGRVLILVVMEDGLVLDLPYT